MASLIFRKGLDLKNAVAGMLAENYHSAIVDRIKADAFTYRAGRLTIHLAREFGFCYGVDRAVDYAYQTRERFPDRPVYLTGEIIHNPHVNDKLRAMDIAFLSDDPSASDRLGPNDIVILPAFGVTMAMLKQLDRRGCTLIDTTCGSVLNVWKNVRRYAEGGYTAIIHGKVWHEETQATASQAVEYGGHYLVVLDHRETTAVCDYIRRGGDRDDFLKRFGTAMSPGFDPDRDLQRIGLANQTTMLMSESLELGELLKAAMLERYGESHVGEHFQAFDTICSATQDRQDAVIALLKETPIDLMIVIGGYNSSNTCNLARICAASRPTFHIADPGCLVSADEIRHRPVGSKTEITATEWLPAGGAVAVGLTSGASTPDNLVGAAIAKLEAFCAGQS
jgi:4-hydroxy-3-methylbut-2-en-1-yl diphosphate reductase